MKVIEDNVQLIRKQANVYPVSLYMGSLCMEPYIGFQVGKTRYVLAWIDENHAHAMIRNNSQFEAAVKRIFARKDSQ